MQYQTVNSRLRSNGFIIGDVFGRILEAKPRVSLYSTYVALVEPSGAYAR